jgi:hypothetical protein
MSDLSAWTEAVHAHAMTNGPIPMRKIIELFGEPPGCRSACDRMTHATRIGYFSKEGARFKAVYTAIPKEQGLVKWTPELKERLAKLWPKRGEACAKHFPGFGASAVKKQAEKMALRMCIELKRARRKKREEEKTRKPNRSFGYIPSGAVRSVFDLGRTVS